jgi:hypothetical protein
LNDTNLFKYKENKSEIPKSIKIVKEPDERIVPPTTSPESLWVYRKNLCRIVIGTWSIRIANRKIRKLRMSFSEKFQTSGKMKKGRYLKK